MEAVVGVPFCRHRSASWWRRTRAPAQRRVPVRGSSTHRRSTPRRMEDGGAQHRALRRLGRVPPPCDAGGRRRLEPAHRTGRRPHRGHEPGRPGGWHTAVSQQRRFVRAPGRPRQGQPRHRQRRSTGVRRGRRSGGVRGAGRRPAVREQRRRHATQRQRSLRVAAARRPARQRPVSALGERAAVRPARRVAEHGPVHPPTDRRSRTPPRTTTGRCRTSSSRRRS